MSVRRRLEDLERRAPKPQEERPLVRPELAAFLDEYAARKRSGTLTPEYEEVAAAIKAEVKKREARGEISRWGGVGS